MRTDNQRYAMVRGENAKLPLNGDDQRRLREVLRNHGVALAAVFGSAVRADGEPADLDLLVEFEDVRPGDDGYASAYLECYSALEDALALDVDLVDVHSMSSAFAGAVLEEAVLLLGDDDRFEALVDRYGGDTPSITDARERIAAAATRLGEGST